MFAKFSLCEKSPLHLKNFHSYPELFHGMLQLLFVMIPYSLRGLAVNVKREHLGDTLHSLVAIQGEMSCEP
jgi:hypothetical protein